jgi:predicted PurR-regulated permease PerM
MTEPARKPPGAPTSTGAPTDPASSGTGRRLADIPPSGPAAARPIAAPPIGIRERRTRNVGWRSRDVVRAAALVFALYILGQLVWFANSLVFVVFLGTLFGLAVAAGVDRVERLGLRRGIASALIVFGSLAAIGGVGAIIAPTLSEQFGELRRQLPQAIDKLEQRIAANPNGFLATLLRPAAVAGAAAGATAPGAEPAAATQPGATPTTPPPGTVRPQPPGVSTGGTQSAAAPSAIASLRDRLGGQLAGATGYLFKFLSSTLAVIGGLVLIIFLAIYIGAEPQLYHDGLMHLFPHRARTRAGEVLTEMATVLRKWLVVQLIAMATIGVVTTIAMLLLNVKAAFALGFIAGLMEFIPTVGPILSAVPAIAMGFVDSPEKALSVVLAYWAIQFLENNLLIPQLMRGGMDIPPALTLVAQALMTLVFGFIGLMVAVPLTAAVLVPIKMLYVRDTIGDDVDLMTEGNGEGSEERDDEDD